jgi:hypothetical protein
MDSFLFAELPDQRALSHGAWLESAKECGARQPPASLVWQLPPCRERSHSGRILEVKQELVGTLTACSRLTSGTNYRTITSIHHPVDEEAHTTSRWEAPASSNLRALLSDRASGGRCWPENEAGVR